jgi:hypothetical protein
LPEKIRKKEFTREEQVLLAGRLRDSVILDAADEAIIRNRRASRNMSPSSDLPSPTSPSLIDSIDMADFDTEKQAVPAAFYESFRWMDEEQDLDLKLVLDDYHANLDGAVIPTPESTRRPSFRRTLSVSKMPFGRNSLSVQPRIPKINTNHNRAISLMAPRNAILDSVSPIDPNATHYQDPEARLKLRVYLASPQKFDEAIEFGFPSMDEIANDKENEPPRLTREEESISPSTRRSDNPYILKDIDVTCLFEDEDDISMLDPDSPLTPMDKDIGFRTQLRPTPPVRASKLSADLTNSSVIRPVIMKRPESYSHGMTRSREMTLRMTLTRPDLRDENAIYGWQSSSSTSPQREEVQSTEMRGPFGGIDGWETMERDNGVVKRFWNKVRAQRKSA